MTELIKAIMLEADFAKWAGDMYPLFSEGGDLNGMGTPREVYLKQCLPEHWLSWKGLDDYSGTIH